MGTKLKGQSTDLCIAYEAISELRPHTRNARTHSKHQIRQIANSIREFGFTNPVLISHEKTIVAGHGRIAAAILLGIDRVPTVRLDKMSEDQLRAYVIADNKLAANAGWDDAILAIELQHLSTIDVPFDITITGFEIPEIDLLLQGGDDEAEESPVDLQPGPPVTQVGDLWRLGKHKILCSSALEEASFSTLMAGKKARMAFTDPPYNVPIDGHASGNGALKHRDFVMGSGEMTEAEFTEFLKRSLSLLALYSSPGSVHYICMDWRHVEELLAAGKQAYGRPC